MFGSFIGNLLGTLYLLCFQIAGITIVQLLMKKENFLLRMFFGSVLGTILLHWLPVLCAFILDFTIPAHLLALLILIICTSILFFRNHPFEKVDFLSLKATFKKHTPFLILFAVFFLFFFFLLLTHTLVLRADGSIWTGQCTFGDMNMHLGFITSIAIQHTFPPDYSILPGTRLSYPFLSDSISSSIYIWGSSLRYAYILPMVIAITQVFIGFYVFAYQWLHKISKSCLAWFFFFLNGGFGFLYFLSWSENPKYSFMDIFKGYYTTPTNLTAENIRWVNIIADMLLPQRATLFGYALLFPCLCLLWKAVYEHKKTYFIWAGIIAGSLPMVHTHSFLSIAIISACWLLMHLFMPLYENRNWQKTGKWILIGFTLFMCLLQYINQKLPTGIRPAGLMIICVLILAILFIGGLYLLVQTIRINGYKQLLSTWGIYLAIVLLLALPQLCYWTFNQVSSGGFVRGYFNWGNLGDQYIIFYLKNLGVVLFLIIPAICACNKRNLSIIFPAFIMWFIAELVVFTPNTYDNNKFLYIAFALLCCLAADYGMDFIARLKPHMHVVTPAIVFLVLSAISACLTLGREAVSELQLYSSSHVEASKFIEKNTPVDAIFLSTSRHNNEIASLTGRNIVCGSGSFLYFHGINSGEREQNMQLMYEDPMNHLDLYSEYEVDYVMVSSWERGNYPQLNQDALDSMFEKVFECNDGEIIIYKTNLSSLHD